MSEQKYDCTADVNQHINLVADHLWPFTRALMFRAANHDASKLKPPEKECFDVYTPKLKELTYGSDEYKAALVAMGEGLKHHYAVNSHHPEHYPDGVAGMDLLDLIEMLCDWVAASAARGKDVDLEFQAKRFGIDPQLLQVLRNTLEAMNRGIV